MDKCLNEFEIRPDATTNYGVICPCGQKNQYKMLWSLNHLSVLIFDWIILILAGKKDMH